MEVRNKNFAAYIQSFTPTTYIMVIQSDASIRKCVAHDVFLLSSHSPAPAATLLNITNAIPHFRAIEAEKIQEGDE